MPITTISCWILVYGQVFLGLYEQQQSEDEGDKEGVNMAPNKGWLNVILSITLIYYGNILNNFEWI